MSSEMKSFTENLRTYFMVSVGLGFLISMVGTFLPSDMLFIVGMFGLIAGIGFGMMDFMEKRRLRKLEDHV